MENLKNISYNIALFVAGAVFILLGLSGGFVVSSYSFLLQEPWARIVSAGFGILLIAISLLMETRSKRPTAPSTKPSAQETSPARLEAPLPEIAYGRLSESEFLQKIDLSKATKVDLLAHTGKRVYDAVHARLEQIEASGQSFPQEIRVLTRTPLVESLYRNNYILNTVAKIKSLRQKGRQIDIRFYESIPAVRGIICEYPSGERVSYLTSYYWPRANESKAYDHAYFIHDSRAAPRPETRLLETWIEQYWGKDELHTVVFDFDDTLVSTGEIQVKAWAQVIDESLQKGDIQLSNLAAPLRHTVAPGGSASGPALLETVRDIFVDKQMAEAILKDLFVNVSAETISKINLRRFAIRERLMDQAELFPGVAQMLTRLKNCYNFAIISSTDEVLISDYLARRGLKELFPIILGKKDPSLIIEHEHIQQKASLLIKLSEIIGIPHSRLVYIGDNRTDYLATRQLGIAFIEARQAALRMGKASLLGEIDAFRSPLGTFDNFEDNQLPALLSQYSKRVEYAKYQIW